MSGPKEKQAMTKSAFIKEVHDAEAMLYHVAKSILKNDADCWPTIRTCMPFTLPTTDAVLIPL